MRKSLTILLSAVVLLGWWFCDELPVAGQVVGEPPEVASGDLNGDGKRDIADAVYLLSFLFDGGPMPVACAAVGVDPDLEARVSALEQKLDDSWEFGRRVAGSYFGDGDNRWLVTLTADGTVHADSQWLFGWEETQAVGPFKFGTSYGTWRRTGERELTACYRGFIFNLDGTPNATGRGTVTFRFVDDTFERYTGTWHVQWFDHRDDPLDPAATAQGPGRDIPFSGRHDGPAACD